MANNQPRLSFVRHVLMVLTGTFVATVIFAFISETFVRRVETLGLAVGFLVLIVIINIAFDVLGTAATAASEAPLNAMAARKIAGAQEGLQLVKNADKVANFANDVIGDVTSIVAGALGISLIAQVILSWPQASEFWLNILVTAFVASVTVAGKAVGKRVAVMRANQVIFLAGRLVAGYNRLVHPSASRKTTPNRKVRKI
ncbi:MAG: hypothetical protein QME13_01810, partial [Thermoanaerobacteraceae bacterium]|nr:hypothetical protein [Thermoanaerobacteraceae bacterium]